MKKALKFYKESVYNEMINVPQARFTYFRHILSSYKHFSEKDYMLSFFHALVARNWVTICVLFHPWCSLVSSIAKTNVNYLFANHLPQSTLPELIKTSFEVLLHLMINTPLTNSPKHFLHYPVCILLYIY
jgi:hypothetical protein